ncbi:hypothetical protein L9F63_024538, partial [Diploptera punctata]
VLTLSSSSSCNLRKDFDSEGGNNVTIFCLHLPVVKEHAGVSTITGKTDYMLTTILLGNTFPTSFNTFFKRNSRIMFVRIKQSLRTHAQSTILLGDSGVGKTSLLVQFDTGKFQTGTFSATVGIGFT